MCNQRKLNYDVEGQIPEEDLFTTISIRHTFIRKVYTILMVQLLATVGVIAFCIFHDPTRRYFFLNPYITFVCIGIMVVVSLLFVCIGSVRRTAPWNYICLIIFTLVESICLGAISIYFEIQNILMAGGVTVIIVMCLTLFAFQTKIDFTGAGVYLFAMCCGLLIFGIFALIFPGRIIMLIYSFLGCLIFMIHIIYDTQIMLGGKHKFSISPDEYAFAALNIYIDVVAIFQYILMIIRILDE